MKHKKRKAKKTKVPKIAQQMTDRLNRRLRGKTPIMKLEKAKDKRAELKRQKEMESWKRQLKRSKQLKIPKSIKRAPTQALATGDHASFQLMERKDEAQIQAALLGEGVEEFVYSFCPYGCKVECQHKKVVGISWIGVQESSRQYGGIQTKIISREETEELIRYTVEATDTYTSSVRLGVSSQLKKMRLSGGGVKEDDFVEQKALSKAQRNAIRQLIPQTWIKAFIMAHNPASKPKQIAAATQTMEQIKAAPAAVTTPQARPAYPIEMISEGQMRLLFLTAKQKGIKDKEDLKAWIRANTPHQIESLTEIRKEWAMEILNKLSTP